MSRSEDHSASGSADTPAGSRTNWLHVTVVAILAGCAWTAFGDGRLNGFGNHDFIQYWTAYGTARAGLDPYSPAQMLAGEKALGWNSPVPLMMWNPPWLLLLFAPILMVPYELSSKLFLALNLLAIVAIARFASDIFAERSKHAPCLATLAVVLSAPVYVALSTGQLSIILAAALALLIRSALRDEPWAGATALAVLSLKPHLFVLTLLVLGWWMLRTKRFFGLIPRTAVLMAALIASAELAFQNGATCWLESVRGHACLSAAGTLPDVPLVRVFDWRVATLVGAISGSIPGLSLAAHKLIMIAVPAAAAIVLLLLLRRSGDRFSWPRWFAPVTCLSLATSPYGWLFDMSATAIAPLRAIYLRRSAAAERQREGLVLLGIFLLIQLLTIVLLKTKALTMHHQYFWYPLAMFLLSCRTESRLRESGRQSHPK